MADIPVDHPYPLDPRPSCVSTELHADDHPYPLDPRPSCVSTELRAVDHPYPLDLRLCRARG